MQNGQQLHVAHAEDLERIRALEAACAPLTPWPAASWRDALNSTTSSLPRRRVFVMEREETLLGFIAAACLEEAAEIETLAVDPSHRRQGVARLLIQAVEEWATAEGAQKLYLEVRASNAAAIGLYRALGFVEQGIRREYYSAPLEDAVLMYRLLLPAVDRAPHPADATL